MPHPYLRSISLNFIGLAVVIEGVFHNVMALISENVETVDGDCKCDALDDQDDEMLDVVENDR